MTCKPTILIVATLDTKLPETLFLRSEILSHGSCQTKVLDVSCKHEVDVDTLESLKDEITSPLKGLSQELASLSRGDYVNRIIESCTPVVQDLVSSGKIQGIVSAAGSTGSSIASAFMRNACPVGFPKLLVSTMASGDVKPYIEETDITMMYSVVDIAGLNSILEEILSNAAGAITGMTKVYAERKNDREPKRKRIAITMFGVTTPCVDHIREILTPSSSKVSDYELYVFHSTGSGGKAMERLIEEGQIDGVIDLTTTEIADELFGGVLTAGPNRLDAAVKRGIPMVLSTGACDMVNFGPKDTVPDKYQARNILVHNPTVTLMRTTKEENAQIGSFIARKLQAAKTPTSVRVLLPTAGISMIDKPGQPFHDQEADGELFKAISDGLSGSEVRVRECPDHINDKAFAVQLCEHLLEVMGIEARGQK